MLDKIGLMYTQLNEINKISKDEDYISSHIWKWNLTRPERIEMENAYNRLEHYRLRVKERIDLIFEN